MSKVVIFYITIFLLLSCQEEEFKQPSLTMERTVFKTGIKYTNGEFVRGTFQPTVISTNKGTVIVLAQGRLNNSEDDTYKTLLFSKSTDEGKTWSKTEFLTKPMPFWGVAAYSYIDNSTGLETITAMFIVSKPRLFAIYNEAELLENFNINANNYNDSSGSILYQLKSIDDGISWEGSVVSENFLNRYHSNGNFVGFFTTVGQWSEIKEGPFKGRFLMGGVVAYDNTPLIKPHDIYDYAFTTSTIIFSDDQGKTWQMGGFTPSGGNEASVAAINGGQDLIIVRRRDDDSQYKRIINYSSDGGLTWTENEPAIGLPSPKCLGILYEDDDKLIYSTPRTTLRTKGWIGVSYDDGQTWSGKIIHPNLFSYSDIERIKNTDKYIVAYSHLHHGEFGLCSRTFTEDWLPFQ